MEQCMRPIAHEIDTLARRLVPVSFPSSWEHREMSGTDYGIDMIIEIFKESKATGKQLLLQLKGTTKEICVHEDIKFDVPVNTLKYSDLFITPVLLVVCRVDSDNKECYYLWLQEYIKVILNYENPNWRNNKSTVRVTIPKKNIIAADYKKLEYISNFPNRMFDWCQFARISSDINYKLASFFGWNELLQSYLETDMDLGDIENDCKKDLIDLIVLIEELINLRGIFGDLEWKQPQSVLEHSIIPALDAAKKIVSNKFEDRDLEVRNLARVGSISALLSICNDYSFSRELWKQNGHHNF